MKKGLDGAWELISDTHTGWMMHLGDYHMFMITENSRAAHANLAEPTEAEELASFRTVSAGAGLFSLTGTQASFTSKLSLVENYNDQTFHGEFIVEGDHLTEKLPSGVTHEWRRIG